MQNFNNSAQRKFNLEYQSQPKLLSYIKYLTHSWHICQNKVEDEKLYCPWTSPSPPKDCRHPRPFNTAFPAQSTLGPAYKEQKDAEETASYKWVLVVTEIFNMVVNGFDAK